MLESDWRSKIMTPLDETGAAREDFKEIIFEHISLDKEGIQTTLRKTISPKMNEWEIMQQECNEQAWLHTVKKRIPIGNREIFDKSILQKTPDVISTKIWLKEGNFSRIMRYNEGEDGRTLDLRIEPEEGFIKSVSTVYTTEEDQSPRVLQLRFHAEEDVVVDLFVHPQARAPQTQFYTIQEPEGTSIGNGGAEFGVPFHLGQNVVGEVSYTDRGYIDTRIRYENPQEAVFLSSHIQVPFWVDLNLYRYLSSSEDFEKWKDAASLVVPVHVKTKGRFE